MSVTRRELCSILPAVLFPALIPLENFGAQENSLPSAMYPFEKLPIRTPNGAQIRDVLKGKLATGESLVSVSESDFPLFVGKLFAQIQILLLLRLSVNL